MNAQREPRRKYRLTKSKGHKHDGRELDAVAQATKPGFVFLLDRETGAPLFPVEERPVPQSDVHGEKSWLTQPFPMKPPPLMPQYLNEEDLWDIDPERLEKCREKLRALRNSLSAVWWALTDRGTGLRYSMVDRKPFKADFVSIFPLHFSVNLLDFLQHYEHDFQPGSNWAAHSLDSLYFSLSIHSILLG